MDTLPRIQVLIGEGFIKTPKNIAVIPDTGAEISIIDDDYLDILVHTQQDVRHVAGGRIDVIGSCFLSLIINGVKIIE